MEDADEARRLMELGWRLFSEGRHAEALAAREEVVRRYGERPEPAIAEQVAKALFNKGVVLGQLGRHAEALAACEEVVRRYGERPEPGIAEAVAKALSNKGNALGRLVASPPVAQLVLREILVRSRPCL